MFKHRIFQLVLILSLSLCALHRMALAEDDNQVLNWELDRPTSEIKALAAKLDHDPAQLFEWVRNNILYTPYAGFYKGAHRTMMERAANDADQCALLVALLRASGYFAHYGHGWFDVNLQQFKSMVRLPASLSHDSPDAFYGLLLSSRCNTSEWANSPLGLNYRRLMRWYVVWRVGPGAEIRMDPSFKALRPISGINLADAAGFAASELIAKAKSQLPGSPAYSDVNGRYQNINGQEVRSYLETKLQSFTHELNTNHPGKSLVKLAGLEEILPVSVSTPVTESQTFTLPFVSNSSNLLWTTAGDPKSDLAVTDSLESMPSTYFHKYQIKVVSTANTPLLTFELNTFAVGGRALVLAFGAGASAGRTSVLVDDLIAATEPGASVATTGSVRVSILHIVDPGLNCFRGSIMGGKTDETVQRSRTIAYLTNWTTCYEPVEWRKRVFNRLRSSDPTMKKKSTVGVFLHLLGVRYDFQHASGYKAAFANVDCYQHCNFPLGQAELGSTLIVDMWGNNFSGSATFAEDGYVESPRNWAAGLLSSALEHGVIEQEFPEGPPGEVSKAASTSRMLEVASSAETSVSLLSTAKRGVVYIDKPNWTSRVSQLSNYSTAVKQEISADFNPQTGSRDISVVPQSDQVAGLIPIESNLTEQEWKGRVWLASTAGRYVPNYVDKNAGLNAKYKIGGANGGYIGGTVYSGYDTSYTATYSIHRTSSALGADIYSASSTESPPITVELSLGGDPIDLASGHYVHEAAGISCGQWPGRGLLFSRYYDGARRSINPVRLGNGWTHNLNIELRFRTELDRAYGQKDPLEGCAITLAASMIRALATPDPLPSVPAAGEPVIPLNADGLRLLLGSYIANWAVDRLKNNVVTVVLGNRGVDFIQSADGIWRTTTAVNAEFKKENGKYVFQERNGPKYVFRDDGKVEKIIDLWSKETLFTYASGTDRLTKVTDPFSRFLSFTYGTSTTVGKVLSTVVASSGATVSFTYDARGNLTVAKTAGKVDNYSYDSTNRLTHVKDGSTIPRIILYNAVFDAQDRVVTQYTPGDATVPWTYAYEDLPDGTRQTVVADPGGGRAKRIFDSKNREVEKIIQPDNPALTQVFKTFYDDMDRIWKTVDPLNQETLYHYDANNNLYQVDHPTGHTTQYFYDSTNRLERQVAPDNSTVTYATVANPFNAYHQPTCVLDRDGIPTWFKYYDDATDLTKPYAGNVKAIRRGGTSWATAREINTFEYDKYGTVSKTFFGPVSENKFELATNTSSGDPLTITRPGGSVTTMTYNLRREMISRKQGVSSIVNTFDASDHLTTTKAGGIATTTYTYSPTGKVVTAKDPTSRTTATAYNSRDLPEKTFMPETKADKSVVAHFMTTTSYDDLGRVKGAEDALARTTSITERDVMDRPTATTMLHQAGDVVRQLSSEYTTLLKSGPESENGKYVLKTRNAGPDDTAEVRYTNSSGQLGKLINRRNKTYLFDYTPSGKVRTITTPLTRVFQTSYDAFGRAEVKTEPSGKSKKLSYDSRDRVRLMEYKAANGNVETAVNFGFDDRGNNLTVTEGAATITRTYDGQDRVLTCTNAQNQKLTFGYDNLNRLTSIVYPNNKKVSYTYDLAGRLTKVLDWGSRATTYTYNTISGRLETILRPNGTRRVFVTDEAGQLTRLEEREPLKLGTVTHDKPIAVFSFLFDGGGRLSKKVQLPLPSAPASAIPLFDATFDDDNRMVTVNGNVIQYDGTSATSDGNMTSAPLPPNLLVSGSSSPTAVFGWDARNRLTSVSSSDGTSINYTYDAEGDLISRDGPGNDDDETYVVNPHASLSRLMARTTSQGTTYYIYGTGLLYELFIATGTSVETERYYHYDQLGSTVAMTGKRPSTTTLPPLLGRVEYSAYGMVTKNTLTGVSTPFLYVGERGVITDRTTGLMSMRARWYHPWLGRFLSEDPIGFQGGMNWFAYAEGNPLLMTDPLGLCADTSGGFFSRAGRMVSTAFEAANVSFYNNFTGPVANTAGSALNGISEVIDSVVQATGIDPMSLGPLGMEETGVVQGLASMGQYLKVATAAITASEELAVAAKTVGSGPARGFIEVSESYSSVNAVKNFQGKGTDFLFDTQTNRFVMGNNPAGHTGIADVMGVAEAQQGRLVGGTIYRENGVLMTNEHSGHFGHLWNDTNRAQFQQFMNNSGVGSTHSATWGR